MDKQAGGKVPELSCFESPHLRWASIMIQMKIIRMRQMVIISLYLLVSLSITRQKKRETNLRHTQMDFGKCTCNGILMGFFKTDIFDKDVQDVCFSLNLFQKPNCRQPDHSHNPFPKCDRPITAYQP